MNPRLFCASMQSDVYEELLKHGRPASEPAADHKAGKSKKRNAAESSNDFFSLKYWGKSQWKERLAGRGMVFALRKV